MNIVVLEGNRREIGSTVTEQEAQHKQTNRSQDDKIVRNVRIGLTISFGALLIILLTAEVYAFVAPTTPEEKKNFIQTIGLLLGGLAALFGLYLNWLNTRTNQRNLLHNQRTLEANQRNTQRTLELTEQGLITDRFTRAVDQLGATADGGNKKLETRLGGIYALERIAVDYPETYYNTAVEIFTAYVRENAPWPPKETTENNRYSDADVGTSEGIEQREARVQTPSDIQAVLDVILRFIKLREEEDVVIPHSSLGLPIEINLSRSNLAGADLNNANFTYTTFFRSHLYNAKLVGCDFRDSNVIGVNFQRALLHGATFEDVEDFEDTDFNGAKLILANFIGADLQEAKGLTEEQLNEAVGDERTKLPEGIERPGSW